MHLLTQKFCYHSTFYREQWKLKAAHGIELTRNLMCSWHDHLAERLLPLYQMLAARLRKSDYLKVDETPLRCLEPGNGKTALGYFWVYHHDEHGVLFRLAQEPRQHLPGQHPPRQGWRVVNYRPPPE